AAGRGRRQAPARAPNRPRLMRAYCPRGERSASVMRACSVAAGRRSRRIPAARHPPLPSLGAAVDGALYLIIQTAHGFPMENPFKERLDQARPSDNEQAAAVAMLSVRRTPWFWLALVSAVCGPGRIGTRASKS